VPVSLTVGLLSTERGKHINNVNTKKSKIKKSDLATFARWRYLTVLRGTFGPVILILDQFDPQFHDVIAEQLLSICTDSFMTTVVSVFQ